jgi:hypothetical protein
MKKSEKAEKYNILSIAAIIISVAAIFFVLVRIDPITIDWMGVLVGILSILVVVLLVKQIQDTQEFNKRVKRIMELEKNITRVNNDSIARFINSLVYLSASFPINTSLKYNGFIIGLEAITLALWHNTDNATSCLEYFLKKFESQDFTIDTLRKERILKAIYTTNIKYEKIIELKNYINHLRIEDIEDVSGGFITPYEDLVSENILKYD